MKLGLAELPKNVLAPEWGTAQARPSPPAMARELRPGALDAYIKAVDAGERLPGAVN